MTIPRLIPIDVRRPEEHNLVDTRAASIVSKELHGRVVKSTTCAENSDGNTTISFTASTNTQVEHGLGRPPRGWIVVRLSGTAPVISEYQDPDSTYLYLVASANCSAAFWVF